MRNCDREAWVLGPSTLLPLRITHWLSRDWLQEAGAQDYFQGQGLVAHVGEVDGYCARFYCLDGAHAPLAVVYGVAGAEGHGGNPHWWLGNLYGGLDEVLDTVVAALAVDLHVLLAEVAEEQFAAAVASSGVAEHHVEAALLVLLASEQLLHVKADALAKYGGLAEDGHIVVVAVAHEPDEAASLFEGRQQRAYAGHGKIPYLGHLTDAQGANLAALGIGFLLVTQQLADAVPQL